MFVQPWKKEIRKSRGRVQCNEIKESRYNTRYKQGRCVIMPEYLSERWKGDSRKLIASV